MKKTFKEFDHLAYYRDKAVSYMLECRSDQSPPDFVPEIFVSCFTVLLFIKYLLIFLTLALCLFGGAALVILCN